MNDSDLVTVVNGNRTNATDSVGFNTAIVQRIVAGLTRGKRLVMRANRASGGRALTYTIPASGAATAWSMIGGCGTRAAASTGSAALTITPTPGATAPKFTRWYFTTCTDAGSGAVRTGLTAGRARLCDLVIETVPNGAQPVRAEFRYGLEYTESGQAGKLTVDSVDTWPSTGGPVTKFRRNGSQLIFTLPLNVRTRSDRVHTSINVTGTVSFSNGSKRVYEPLPVRPRP